MGKRRRFQMQRGDVRVRYNSPQAIRQIFGGEGQEALTDELIDDLVARGWERDFLIFARLKGAKWSRSRRSLIFPPELA